LPFGCFWPVRKLHASITMTIKKIALRDLDWDDMRVFLAVARLGSLSSAARQLHQDNSTISRRIAQLELSLGGALFERHRSGLKPTELAESIEQHAQAMECAMVGLREALGGEAREPFGQVRVATMEGIGSMYLARKLAPLVQRYPEVKIELVTSAQQVHVTRREADVFLSFFKPAASGLHTQSAGTFSLYLYGSQAYFDRCGVPTSVTDLEQHSFCSYIDDLVQLDAVRWLNEVITHPRLAFQSTSMLAQMTAAASGIGLVLLPRFAVVREVELRPVLADTVSVQREIWVSAHHDLRYSNRIRTVIDFLVHTLTQDQGWLNSPG
jgi:DNA-binding transcriptional LysR family regulator